MSFRLPDDFLQSLKHLICARLLHPRKNGKANVPGAQVLGDWQRTRRVPFKYRLPVKRLFIDLPGQRNPIPFAQNGF
jgi:hypothetical protein